MERNSKVKNSSFNLESKFFDKKIQHHFVEILLLHLKKCYTKTLSSILLNLIGHYEAISQDYNLVSHTTYVVYDNFIHQRRACSLMVLNKATHCLLNNSDNIYFNDFNVSQKDLCGLYDCNNKEKILSCTISEFSRSSCSPFC